MRFHNEQGDLEFEAAALHVTGKIALSSTIFGEDLRFLQSAVTSAVPKLAIPSPSMGHYRGGRAAIDRGVYPELDEFWGDLVAAYREEVRRLGDLGCTYLQLDDTSLAYLNDPAQRQYVAPIGGDSDGQHLEYIRHVNEVSSRGDSAGMSVTTHMCRGNSRSPWVAEGGYDFVAEALLNELDVDGFFMEWDEMSARAVSSHCASSRRASRSCSASSRRNGASSSRPTSLQAPDRGGRKIRAGSTSSCLSPQCGFSSTVEWKRAHRRGAGGEAPPDRRGRRRRLGAVELTPGAAVAELLSSR